MHGVVGAALFAVIDDVEAALDLLADDIADGFAYGGLQFGAAGARLLLLGQQQLDGFAVRGGCRCGW